MATAKVLPKLQGGETWQRNESLLRAILVISDNIPRWGILFFRGKIEKDEPRCLENQVGRHMEKFAQDKHERNTQSILRRTGGFFSDNFIVDILLSYWQMKLWFDWEKHLYHNGGNPRREAKVKANVGAHTNTAFSRFLLCRSLCLLSVIDANGFLTEQLIFRWPGTRRGRWQRQVSSSSSANKWMRVMVENRTPAQPRSLGGRPRPEIHYWRMLLRLMRLLFLKLMEHLCFCSVH